MLFSEFTSCWLNENASGPFFAFLTEIFSLQLKTKGIYSFPVLRNFELTFLRKTENFSFSLQLNPNLKGDFKGFPNISRVRR